jgi:hypothetical protein
MTGKSQQQFWLMLRAQQEGISGSRTLAMFRQQGLGMRTQSFYRMWALAGVTTREAGAEPTRPPDEVPEIPEGGNIPVRPRVTPGVLQTVRLTLREKVTGKFRTVYHQTKSPEGVTRQQAIENAVTAYESQNAEYETTVVAASHTSARRMVPMEAAA